MIAKSISDNTSVSINTEEEDPTLYSSRIRQASQRSKHLNQNMSSGLCGSTQTSPDFPPFIKTNAVHKSSLGEIVSSTAATATSVLSMSSNDPSGTNNNIYHRRSIHTIPSFSFEATSSIDSVNFPSELEKPLRKQHRILSRSNSSIHESFDKKNSTVNPTSQTFFPNSRAYGSASSLDVIDMTLPNQIHLPESDLSAKSSTVKLEANAKQPSKAISMTRSIARAVQFDLANSTTQSIKTKDAGHSLNFLKRFRKSSGNSSGQCLSSPASPGPPSVGPAGTSNSLPSFSMHQSTAVNNLQLPGDSACGDHSLTYTNCIQINDGPRLSQTIVHHDVASSLFHLPQDYIHQKKTSLCSSWDNMNSSSSSDAVFSPTSEKSIPLPSGDNHPQSHSDSTVTTGIQQRCQHQPRRNTGASAASGRPLSPLSDLGDGQSNNMVQSCPFFRNELGGEALRIPCLTRVTHRGLGLYPCLTSSGNVTVAATAERVTPWCNAMNLLEAEDIPSLLFTPFDSSADEQVKYPIEFIDRGATYYRDSFYKHEDHQNWFGLDETYGPIAVSLKREKFFDESGMSTPAYGSHSHSIKSEESSTGGGGVANGYLWRFIIRTKELTPLRGSVLEDLVPCSSRFSSSRGVPGKDILQHLVPDLPLTSLRQGVSEAKTHDQLLRLDEFTLNRRYKIGVLLCKSGQGSEEEMYCNEHSSAAFDEFLDLIAKKVQLLQFNKYKGGLDTKSDTTGTHSYHTEFRGNEIMFHVATHLPFTQHNSQQVMRKRHIGNDIVTIIFQEPGAFPFSPQAMRSQFQHVFIVVRVSKACTDNTTYSVAVSKSGEVPYFGPPLPPNSSFTKSKDFVDFLLTKAINGENAVGRSPKFVEMQRRTREDYLKELALNHVTTNTLDTKSNKFFLGSGRRKDKHRARPDQILHTRGGVAWQVCLNDFSLEQEVSCLLLIGSEQLVLVEESSRLTIFTIPCRSVIGWNKLSDIQLRIYYNIGEFIELTHLNEAAQNEIIQRLDFLSPGCPTITVSVEHSVFNSLNFNLLPGEILLTKASNSSSSSSLNQKPILSENARILSINDQSVLLIDWSKFNSQSDFISHLYKNNPPSISLTVLRSDSIGGIRRGSPVKDIYFTNNAIELFTRNSGNSSSQNDNSSENKPMNEEVKKSYRRRSDIIQPLDVQSSEQCNTRYRPDCIDPINVRKTAAPNTPRSLMISKSDNDKAAMTANLQSIKVPVKSQGPLKKQSLPSDGNFLENLSKPRQTASEISPSDFVLDDWQKLVNRANQSFSPSPQKSNAPPNLCEAGHYESTSSHTSLSNFSQESLKSRIVQLEQRCQHLEAELERERNYRLSIVEENIKLKSENDLFKEEKAATGDQALQSEASINQSNVPSML